MLLSGIARRHVASLLACLAALPQIGTYAGHVASGNYPGSAYRPRVDTELRMSATAAKGGPFATVRVGNRFSLAVDVVPDLGIPAVLDLVGRLTGRSVTVRFLGATNLLLIGGALLGLVFAVPRPHRLALAPVFLLMPVSVPEYRSADTVAVHGALGVLGVAVAAAVVAGGSVWPGIGLGLVLFGLYVVRSVYGLYAIGSAMALAGLLWLLTRDRHALLRPAAAVAAFASVLVPWHGLLAARAADPRVVEKGMVTSHDGWAMLISGLGWTDNRWGIDPSDPKVSMFIADRLGLPQPPPLMAQETERLARSVYLSLWRESPLELAGLYLSRVPEALAAHGFLGSLTAAVWLPCLAAALAVAWRRKEREGFVAAAAPALLAGCLVAQIVLIDPRLIYSYPLQFLSALSFATAVSVLIPRWGRSRLPGAPARSTGQDGRTVVKH